MKKKNKHVVEKFIPMLILFITGSLVGWAVAIKNLYIALGSFGVGFLLLQLYRKTINEIIEDELVRKISEQASNRSLTLVTIVQSLIGIYFIIENNVIGYALCYSSIALVVVYVIFYIYYKYNMLK